MGIKRIIALILAATMIASFAVGCKSDDKPKNDVPTSVVTPDPDTTGEETDEPKDDEELSGTAEQKPEDDEDKNSEVKVEEKPEQKPVQKPAQKPQQPQKEPEKEVKPPIPMPEEKPDKPIVSVTLDDAYKAVKNAYGKNYAPDFRIEEKEILADMYGVNTDEVDEYFVEVAMISTKVDTFIGIKAVAGKAASVESALKAYLQNEIENGINYPSNVAKVANAKVIKKGDFVFLMMLGQSNSNAEATEEEMTKFAQEQIAIGVNALNDCFK